MAATIRLRLSFTMALGPLHPVGKADVYLSIQPELDGTVRVDITRIAFVNNPLFSFAARVVKERLADQVNQLVRQFLIDLPSHFPAIDSISILEIDNRVPA